MHGLRSAAGFVQTKVADRLTTRYVPHITFILDEGVKKSIEIARLIREENELSAAAAVIVPTDDGDTANDEAAEHHAEQPEPAEHPE
jgi:ribosome-binding factor A